MGFVQSTLASALTSHLLFTDSHLRSAAEHCVDIARVYWRETDATEFVVFGIARWGAMDANILAQVDPPTTVRISRIVGCNHLSAVTVVVAIFAFVDDLVGTNLR